MHDGACPSNLKDFCEADKVQRISEPLFCVEQDGFALQVLANPFRLAVASFRCIGTLPAIAVLFPSDFKVALQQADDTEIAMKFGILRMQSHSVGVVSERQVDTARPSVQGTSIAISVEVIGFEFESLFEPLIGFFDPTQITE